jgi:hypothetical protein
MFSFNQVSNSNADNGLCSSSAKFETRMQTLGYVVYRSTILAHAPGRVFRSSEIVSSRDTLMR